MRRREEAKQNGNRGLVWAMAAASAVMVVLAVALGNTGRTPSSQALVAAAMTGRTGVAGLRAAAASNVYYEPTIRDIINRDCSSCHSGPSRNLMDYDNLNNYAQSGMLAAMVQGPMAGFAGADADTILAWVDAGAPEKASAGAAPAAMLRPLGGRGFAAAPGGWLPLP